MDGSTKPPNKVVQGQLNDQLILQVVHEYPLVTAKLIAYVTGIPLGTVQNRLTRLSHAKRIAEQQLSLNEPYLYRARGRPKVSQVEHMLGVAEFRAALTVATRGRSGVRVGDAFLQELEGAGKTVKPDWPLVIEDQEDLLYFFLEIDKGTMRKPHEYLEKYEGYWRWREKFCYETDGHNRWGIEQFRVLTLADTSQRMETLRDIARKVHPNGKISTMFWFTSRERWSLADPEQLLQPVWVTAKDDHPHSILE